MDATKMVEAAALGVARYQAWKRKFIEQYAEQLIVQRMRMMLAMMPPEAKEAMKQQDPERYALMMDMLQNGGR